MLGKEGLVKSSDMFLDRLGGHQIVEIMRLQCDKNSDTSVQDTGRGWWHSSRIKADDTKRMYSMTDRPLYISIPRLF